jgi:hypothetical protein
MHDGVYVSVARIALHKSCLHEAALVRLIWMA